MRAGRAATSIALIVLASLALAYAYLFDRAGTHEPDPAGGGAHVFPGLDGTSVRSIVLERGVDRLALERASDGGVPWAMTSPYAEPADPASVDALVGDLAAVVRLRDASLDPAAAGMGRLRGRILLGDRTVAFALGGPAPVPEGASYMTVDDSAVFVVGKLLTEDLLRGPDAYRDRLLVPYGAPEAHRVELRDAESDGGIVLTRSGATFRIAGPLRADREAVERLFAALADARAGSFLAADAGSATQSAALSLTIDAISPMRPQVALAFGGPCPGDADEVAVTATAASVRRSACVPKTVPDALRAAEATIVDSGLFHARSDEITELRFEPVDPKGAALDLARKGRGWHERSPDDRELEGSDADAANALAERLTSHRATEVRAGLDGEPFAARARVTVVGVDGVSEAIEVGPPRPDGTLLVRRDDDGALLSMPKDAARDLAARTPR